MKFTSLNIKEYASFLLCGAANTVLTYAMYAVFLLLMPYKLSYSLAYICGIIISYYLNSQFVFKEPVSLAKFLKYPVVYIVQYLLGIVILYICVDVLAISKWLAPIVVIIISLPVTFGLSKLIIKGPE
ncbi:MAG: GtrA family protein [Firmicutes bacterium HGW-Firmicutes-15]|nr:MAG: GtrA family protein [Firmicutes bacterium HGW-Firmicutes-15]